MNLLKVKASSWLHRSQTWPESELSSVARHTRMLAVLLEAGLNSADAERYSRTYGGLSLHSAVPTTPHAFVAMIWKLVHRTGAPPAELLHTCAEALDAAAENVRVARVHLAGPQAATRLVMTLPLLALGASLLTGYNPLPFLLFTPPGWFLLVMAGGLVWVASRWSARMVRGAQHWDWARGMPSEVMALLLRAGCSVDFAREWAGVVARDYCHNSTESHNELRRCDEFVSLAFETGVSLVALLRSIAQQERSDARHSAQEKTEKLSVSLMIPLGVCILPAFIAVGVVPLVMSILSSTTLQMS